MRHLENDFSKCLLRIQKLIKYEAKINLCLFFNVIFSLLLLKIKSMTNDFNHGLLNENVGRGDIGRALASKSFRVPSTSVVFVFVFLFLYLFHVQFISVLWHCYA